MWPQYVICVLLAFKFAGSIGKELKKYPDMASKLGGCFGAVVYYGFFTYVLNAGGFFK